MISFLENCWYVAALSSELKNNLLRRIILEKPVLLSRDEDSGEVGALVDICPHRFAPLSKGTKVHGGIQCGYHGLVFNWAGKCILNPHGNGKILPSAKVNSFPVVERFGLIWIWMGQTDLADVATIPDFSYLDLADQRTRTDGYLPTAANYQLLTDNILDLSHADFLHPLLDSGGGVREAAPRVEDGLDGAVNVSWTWGPTVAMPFLAHLLEKDATVFTRLAVRWQAPATMRLTLTSSATREGLESSSAPQTLIASAMHIMTPQDNGNTHYFYGGVRNFDVANDEFTKAFAEGTRKAFSFEDKPMIEAVQANMRSETDIFALAPLGLIGDAGGVRVRRKLEQLIRVEQAQYQQNL